VVRLRLLCSQRSLTVSRRASTAECAADSVGLAARVEFSDPARFSFDLGGKDGHPFPVPLKTYDETIRVLRRSLETTKVGNRKKSMGFDDLIVLCRP
jgi:hypothetical protein